MASRLVDPVVSLEFNQITQRGRTLPEGADEFARRSGTTKLASSLTTTAFGKCGGSSCGARGEELAAAGADFIRRQEIASAESMLELWAPGPR